MDSRIDDDFKEAVELAQVFDSYRPVQNFVQSWDYDQYVASEPPTDQLKADLIQISRWFNDVDKNMRSGFCAGIYHIESRKLKQTLGPKVEAAVNNLKELLIKTFSKKCSDLVLVYFEKRKMLSSIPEQLKVFASYVDKIKLVKTERIGMEAIATQVETMSSLLRQFEVKISASDSVQLEALRELAKNLTEPSPRLTHK